MATRGRRPKPTVDKILNGNPGRRPLNAEEPEPAMLSAVPRAPRGLGPGGSKIWREAVPQLMDAGLLTVLDVYRFRRYCTWTEIFEAAAADVKTRGKYLLGESGLYPNPSINLMSQAEKALGSTEGEFGMTPASRSKVKAANTKQGDLFGDFLEGHHSDDEENPTLN